MRVAVNLRPWVPRKIGGMENYVRTILTRLIRRDARDLEFMCLLTTKENHDWVDFDDPRVRRVLFTDEKSASDQAASTLRQCQVDVLFCPLIDLEPRHSITPSFVTIPDIQHEMLPEMFDSATLSWRRDAYRAAVSLATGVFTLSEFSRQAIVKVYGVPDERVYAAGLDVDDAFRHPPTEQQRLAVRSHYGIRGPFLLYPAVTWPHKNHIALLRALAMYIRSYKPLTLVLTGSAAGFHSSVLDTIRALGLEPHVRVLGYVPQDDLKCLYTEARAMVFPSLYEGFGLPILEAFHCGCPVISSDRTSCPEIGGDAAVYINPEDPEAIVKALLDFENSSETRDDFIRRGHDRTAAFSWDRVEHATFEVMQTASASYRTPIQVTSWPTITVVTPSLNQARFIGDAIDSVLAQRYVHLDYVVIDGGSTDGTVEILKRHNRELRWLSERDEGQADAVNKGVALARGQIIGWLNSDDVYVPGALETAAEAFLRSHAVDVLYGEAEEVLADGTFFRRYPTTSFDYQRLAYECFICQPATFFRRAAFQEVGGLDPSLHYCMDYDLWIRLGRRFRFAHLPEVLARSRLHIDSKTLGRRRQVFPEIIRTVRRHYGFVPFSWALGHMDFLFNRSEREVFEAKRRSNLAFVAALLYTLWVNRSSPEAVKLHFSSTARRILQHVIPPPATFEGQWPDGWISKRYVTELTTVGGARNLVISGRHEIPGSKPLRLTFRLDGMVVRELELRKRGPFSLVVAVDPRSGTTVLDIEADRTFCPRYRGKRDARRLSCLIDEVRYE
jgi:glycosyltransferase involved in cell wall biosynthesis